VDADKLDDDEKLRVDQLDLFAYVAGEYRAIGEKLGTHGFTK